MILSQRGKEGIKAKIKAEEPIFIKEEIKAKEPIFIKLKSLLLSRRSRKKLSQVSINLHLWNKGNVQFSSNLRLGW